MNENTVSKEELLHIYCGLGTGLILGGILQLIGEPTVPTDLIGFGVGTIGLTILWYLWATRENHIMIILGGSDD